MKKSFLSFLTLLVVLASCTPNEKNMKADNRIIDTRRFDSTYKPVDDFYDFVDAKWIKANPIPPTESSRRYLEVVQDSVKNKLRKVLETAASDKNAAPGSSTQKVGDFYATGMDSVTIEKQGIDPLKPWLDTVANFKNANDVIRFTANANLIGATAILACFVDQDQMNSKKYILYVPQTGLGLPDRDYYFRNDEKSKQIRDEYVKHIAKYLTLTGTDQAAANKGAQSIMKMETNLAAVSMTQQEQRDPYATYHKMSKDDLKKKYPDINWDLYFATLTVKPFDSLVVNVPAYLAQVNKIISSAAMDDWKNYYRFHLVDGVASLLSSEYANEDFNFNERVMRGVEQQDPRWKRIQKLANLSMGELLGQEYVKTNFTPESKQHMLDLIHNLIASYSERIAAVDWMSDSTKKYAQKKLSDLLIKVGYPDKWRDYSSLQIDKGPFVLNVMRSIAFETHRNLNKLGTPVDRTEWGMTPQTVNAYYNPTNNEIVFPAAILQPPYYWADGDDAVNYGAIGAAIGHEITHGFDDEGRLYDAEGNLKKWWTSADSAAYTARTRLIAQQYNQYSPIDTFHLNGNLTQGENIADLGGLTIAYHAFKKAQQNNPGDTMKIAGLTPDQRFFVSFATIWAGSFRPEEAKRRIIVDHHSPGKYRVIGVCSNMPEFYEAFNVKPGDGMYRSDSLRGKVW